MSLLPASMPELPHLDIAAYMKTATEVGGDYYDVHVAKDGCVTLVVGDATGHGLRAGTLVTAAKSLFRAYAHDPDLTRILRESSRVLQEMNLGALFMALQIIRITDGHFAFASAGMPPAVVYRAATGKVEAVSAPAPPLGVALPASYSVQKHPLAPGDALLLMSDGLPERFNPARENAWVRAGPFVIASSGRRQRNGFDNRAAIGRGRRGLGRRLCPGRRRDASGYQATADSRRE